MRNDGTCLLEAGLSIDGEKETGIFVDGGGFWAP
jgi:hypothetical protein